ncbi:SRPBCC family protein [Chromobacterium vaccinii]|uniref:Polyketide cyclase n=1 Tax=Chromobacterium vaccinii TaxID=1108595 RepID=A0A1D9LCX3_9NEIS|nr:SRPBCC family protein [Chromobacterium vaccinii]AOZ49112.1 polyketide cyclase [Chromobacterium vaccinii]
MAEYRFSTIWRIHAPLPAVWDAIFHADAWPSWWKSAKQVAEIESGDAHGVGTLHRYTWKGALPYRLSFNMRVTRIEPFRVLEGKASGAVEGKGIWHFSNHEACTVVRYDWHIHTTIWWMNWLAPLACRLFRWNHDEVMRQGARGLAQRLGVNVEMDGRTFPPQ